MKSQAFSRRRTKRADATSEAEAVPPVPETPAQSEASPVPMAEPSSNPFAGLTSESLAAVVKALAGTKELLNDKAATELIGAASEELANRPVEVENAAPKAASRMIQRRRKANSGGYFTQDHGKGQEDVVEAHGLLDDKTGVERPKTDCIDSFGKQSSRSKNSGDPTRRSRGKSAALKNTLGEEVTGRDLEYAVETAQRWEGKVQNAQQNKVLAEWWAKVRTYLGESVEVSQTSGGTWTVRPLKSKTSGELLEKATPEDIGLANDGLLKKFKDLLYSLDGTYTKYQIVNLVESTLSGDNASKNGSKKTGGEFVEGLIPGEDTGLENSGLIKKLKDLLYAMDGTYTKYQIVNLVDSTMSGDNASKNGSRKEAAAEISTASALKKSEDLGDKLKALYLEAKIISTVNDTRPVRDAIEAIYVAARKFEDASKVLNKLNQQEEQEEEAAKAALKDKKSSKKAFFGGLNLVVAENE